MASALDGRVVLDEGENVFEVTLHAGLAAAFNQWLESHDQWVSYFGENEAGTPAFVATIRPGTPTARRFESGGRQ